MNGVWNFFTCGQLVFGPGAVEQLPDRIQGRWRKVAIISDANLERVGIVERVVESLRRGGIESHVFTGGQAEPEIAVADEALQAARDYGPDAVLGLGGGSNMDVAKFVATALQHGGQPRDYFGIFRVPGPVFPLICVPTTSGTGSEVSHAAVLTDVEQQIKISCLSNHLRPLLAVVDPSLTYDCPRQVMADSGIDALTHAVEAITAVDHDRLQIPDGEQNPYEGRFPLGECLGEKAIELIGQHLVAAVNDPADKGARDAMSLASTLAGMAFSNCGVALVHAMEYPLGAILHCSHGAGNGLLLPFVMQFNLPERIPTMARIAKLLGVVVDGLSDEQAAQRGIDAIHQLKQDIGIPITIRDLGGDPSQIPLFAQKAHAIQRLMWFNPRQPSLEDIAEIYRQAF